MNELDWFSMHNNNKDTNIIWRQTFSEQFILHPRKLLLSQEEIDYDDKH